MSFDPVSEADRSALGGTNYADWYRDIDGYYGSDQLIASYGAAGSANVLNPADLNVTGNVAGTSTYWLQIVRDGGGLSMNISYDGTTYTNALTTTLTDPANSFNELVLSGTTFETAGSFTNFDYVSITGTSTPEPSSAVIGLSGLMLMLLGRLWVLRKTGFPARLRACP